MKIEEKNSEKEIDIIIKPQYDESFVETTINCKPKSLPFSSYKTKLASINCTFSSINSICINYWRMNIRLSLKNYQYMLEEQFKTPFEEEILEAYLKCIPFICNGYTELLDFPSKHQEEFKKYFDSKKAAIERSFEEEMRNFNRKYASYIEYVNPKTDDKTEK